MGDGCCRIQTAACWITMSTTHFTLNQVMLRPADPFYEALIVLCAKCRLFESTLAAATTDERDA